MTLSEFKAWFEGFTESMEAAPSKKQWERIKARVAEINGVAVTREVIYRDRYWPTQLYGTTFPVEPYITWNTASAASGISVGGASSNNLPSTAQCLGALGKAEFNQTVAAG